MVISTLDEQFEQRKLDVELASVVMVADGPVVSCVITMPKYSRKARKKLGYAEMSCGDFIYRRSAALLRGKHS